MALDKNAVTKEAQKFIAKGQFDKAIAEWKKLLKESPNDPNIFNMIGDLCLKKNSKAEAVDAYKRAADILAEDGFASKAIALYKKVLNIDPKKVEVHLALGDMNAEKGLTGNALESYKIAADHYSKNKETVKALGIYQKMADLNPANVAFRMKLADMYAKQNMKPEASKAYLEAAGVHISKDAFNEARQLFEKVLSLDPDNKEVYHKAGLVYFREGKFAEACKALKRAFENDPSNQELADTYLDALSKAGKGADAEEVINKLLAENPDKIELREKLYQAYRSSHDLEKAAIEASTLADAKAASGAPEAAEELFKTFVAENPEFAEGHRRFAEFYASQSRSDDASKELLLAADALISIGDGDGARAVLGRALELVPGLTEAQSRIERLDAPAAAPQPAVLAEPAPAREWKSAPPQPAAEAVEFAPAGEEDPAVNEAFIEIEVLIKYGLMAKAAEQLETLSSTYPESLRTHLKLREVWRGLGNTAQAVQHALSAADLYTKRGQTSEAKAELQAAKKIDPRHPEVLARIGGAPVAQARPQPIELEENAFGAMEPEPAAPDAFQPPEITLDHFEMPAAAPEAPPPAFDEIPTIEEPAPAPPDEITFDGLDLGAPHLEATVPPKPAAPAPPVATRPATVDLGEIWAEAEFYFQQGLFDEARKHYAKIIEHTPGDKRALNRLMEISREEEETQEFSKLADAVDELGTAIASAPSPAEMAMTSSDEEAVRSLMREIHDIKKQEQDTAPPLEEIMPPRKAAAPKRTEPARKAPEPPKRPVAPPKKPERPAAAEEDFFDLGAELEAEGAPSAPKSGPPSDDFFDLAAELRDELSAVPAPARSSASTEEQSLDDIFEDFKKGIEQQAVKEDADTHYNLGVAYKEMGLLDDAIAEFILTPEDEPKVVQSRYMLGLCYMEKGEYQNAVGEIQNALDYSELMGIDADNRTEMRYDLGLAFQGSGNNEGALKEFNRVFEANSHFRDVSAKIKDLQQGDFISFDQLKDDIEKEISSKFLEEGERIQREEKTRKNEKVKG
jgi:tetratricopeptide (TPR) repeat protein